MIKPLFSSSSFSSTRHSIQRTRKRPWNHRRLVEGSSAVRSSRSFAASPQQEEPPPKHEYTRNNDHQQHPQQQTLVVALSGGVDSSVAAALLQQQLSNNSNSTNNHHYNLTAVHMTNWNHHDPDEQQETTNTCSEQDWKDAQRVAQHLQLPLTRQRLEAEYWNQVFLPYLDNLLLRHHMGNPDTDCNLYIKFGALRENLQTQYGPNSWLATGHYARLWYGQQRHRGEETTDNGTRHPPFLPDYTDLVEEHIANDPHNNQEWLFSRFHKMQQSHSHESSSHHPWLLAAADKRKDQSYFLSTCSSAQLQNVLFPLGDYFKKEEDSLSSTTTTNTHSELSSRPTTTVRDLAHHFQLPTADKRESMGICFIGKRRRWKDFVQEYMPPQESLVDFCDIETGRVLSSSMEGPPTLYAIGRGAQLGGMAERYFVCGYDDDHDDDDDDDDENTKNDNDQQTTKHRVWVCPGTHHPALYADWFTVRDLQWVHPYTIPHFMLEQGGVLHCHCRIRHLQPLMDCAVTYNCESNEYTIRMVDQPLRGISPGQVLALYVADGLVCLGGGTIQRRGPSYWKQGKSVSVVQQQK